jgi:ribosomal protein S6E (S10)
MIVNISNPKTSKTYSAKVDEIPFVGKKLGDEVNLDVLGFKGKGIITGGSTKEGFPMVPFLENPANKNVCFQMVLVLKQNIMAKKEEKQFMEEQ